MRRDEYGNPIEYDSQHRTWHLQGHPELLVDDSGSTTNYINFNNGDVYAGSALADGSEKPAPATPRPDNSFFDDLGAAAKSFVDNLKQENPDDSKWAADQYQQTVAQMQLNYQTQQDADADRAAQVEQIANDIGVPNSILQGASDETKDYLIKQRQAPDLDDVAKNSPMTAEYLSDTDNMRISHDDIPTLQWVENTGRQISGAFELSQVMYQLNDIDYKAAQEKANVDEYGGEEVQKRRQALLAREKELENFLNPSPLSLASGVRGLTDMAQNALSPSAFMGAATGAAIGAMGLGITAIPAALAFWQGGMAIDAGRQQQGEMYRAMQKAGVENGRAANASAMTGVAAAVMSLPVFGAVGRQFKGIITHSPLLKRVVEGVAVPMAAGGVQGAANAVGEDYAGLQTNYKDEILQGALSGGALGLMITVPGMGWAALSHIRHGAQESKTLKRDPERAEADIDRKVPINAELPAGELNKRLALMSPEDREGTIKALGTTQEKINDQATIGGTIRISSGQYALLPSDKAESAIDEIISVEGKPSAQDVVDAVENGDRPTEPTPYDESDVETPQDYETRKAEEVDEPTIAKNVADQPDNVARRDLETEAMNGTFDGQKTLDKVMDDYDSGRMTDEESEALEDFAVNHGYGSADEMMKKLKKLPSEEEQVKSAVDKAGEDFDRAEGHDTETEDMRKTSTDENIEQIDEETDNMVSDEDSVIDTATEEAGEVEEKPKEEATEEETPAEETPAEEPKAEEQADAPAKRQRTEGQKESENAAKRARRVLDKETMPYFHEVYERLAHGEGAEERPGVQRAAADSAIIISKIAENFKKQYGIPFKLVDVAIETDPNINFETLLKGIAGAYSEKNGTIRLFQKADERTATHEMAHAFSVQLSSVADMLVDGKFTDADVAKYFDGDRKRADECAAQVVADKKAIDEFTAPTEEHFNEYKYHKRNDPNRKGKEVLSDLEGEFGEYERQIKAGEEGHGGYTPERRFREERFARAFEKYLAEGKAPNAKMRNVFKHFKAWYDAILDAWGTLRGRDIDPALRLGRVELTPEMNDLFSRMLAVDKSESPKAKRMAKTADRIAKDNPEGGVNMGAGVLCQRLSDRAKEVRENIKDIQKTIADGGDVKDQLAKVKESTDALKKLCDEGEKYIAHADKAIARLEAKVDKRDAQLDTQRAKLKEQREAARTQIKELKADLRTLDKMATRLQKEHLKEIDKGNAQKQSFNLRLAEMRDKLKATQDKFKAIVRNISKESKTWGTAITKTKMSADALKAAKTRVAIWLNYSPLSESADYRHFDRARNAQRKKAARFHNRLMTSAAVGSKRGGDKVSMDTDLPTHNVDVDTSLDGGTPAQKQLFNKIGWRNEVIRAKYKEQMATLALQHSLAIFDRMKKCERKARRIMNMKLDSVGDEETRYQLASIANKFKLGGKRAGKVISNVEKNGPEHIQTLQDWVDEHPRPIQQPRKTLRQHADDLSSQGIEMEIPDEVYSLLENPGITDYHQLNIHQLKMIVDAMDYVRRAGKMARQMATSEHGKTIVDGRNEQMQEMRMGSKPTNDIAEDSRMANNHRHTVKSFLKAIINDQLTISTQIARLVGYSKNPDDSATFHFWVRTPQMIAERASTRVREIYNDLDRIWNPKGMSTKDEWKFANIKYWSDDLGCNLTKQEMVMILLNSGSEENSAKVFGGTIDGKDVEKTLPVEVESQIRRYDSADKWTRENVLKFIGEHLTRDDLMKVQQTWDVLSKGLWDDLKKKEYERTGKIAKQKSNIEFDMKCADGSTVHLTGGYYPLYENPKDNHARNGTEEMAGALETMKNMSTKLGTSTFGRMKQVTQKAYAISLSPQTLRDYIQDAVHDLYFRDWEGDAIRIYNNKEFKDTVYARLGDGGVKAFDDYIRTVMNVDEHQTGAKTMDAVMSYLRKATTTARIALNFGVAAQNPANVFRYAQAIDGWTWKDTCNAYIKYGLNDYWPKLFFGNAKNYVRQMGSPFMMDLMDRPEVALADFEKKILGDGMYGKSLYRAYGEEGVRKLVEFSGHVFWLSDSFASVPVWKGCYEKFYNKAIQAGKSEMEARQEGLFHANNLVRSVNGSGRRMDLAPAVKARNGWWAMANSFMGFFNNEANRFFREVGRFRENPIQDLPRAAAYAFVTFVLFQQASNILMGKPPDGPEDVLRDAVTAPLNNWMISKNTLVPAIQSATGGDNYGFRPPIALTTFQESVGTWSKWAKYFEKGGDKEFNKAAEGTTKTVSDAFGIPMPIQNFYWNLVDFTNNTDPNYDGIKLAVDTFYGRRHHKEKQKK